MAFPPDLAFSYIEKAWREERLGHAYLISGLGTADRRHFAERIVRLVNRSDATDLAEMAGEGVHVVEPESKSRRIIIDQIRDLEHVLHLRGAAGKWRVGIIVDADRMGDAATNAFLKTLEEPPQGCLLLLLTASPGLLLDTVLSRCLRVTLFQPGASGQSECPEARHDLISAVAQHFASPPSAARALALLRTYSGLLVGLKDSIADENESERKRENSHYKERTDVSSAWVKERTEHFDALTSARYLQSRARLIEVLLLWFGDLLRQRAGSQRLEFPEFAATIEAAAQKFSTDDLLRRLHCLEDLVRYYDTNVNEALATELAFLGAFG